MEANYIDMNFEKDFNKIQVAANAIKNGNLVLFPTETVYGIGANGLNDIAVSKIFKAKGRDSDNPLILHISNMEMLEMLVNINEISDLEYKLMNTFWPGPFTIILNKKENIANKATCNGKTIGIRMPSNEIAYELIKRAGVPIAAPSANVSGRPSGTNIKDIFNELHNKVEYIIDGGECEIGLESTVVRVIDNKVKILRPGRISKEDIESVAKEVEIDKHVLENINLNETVLSPGMKYRHYAPKTKCILVYSDNNDILVNKINELMKDYKSALVLCTSENKAKIQNNNIIDMGSKNNLNEISKKLFKNLRKIDEYKTDIAIIEGVSKNGIGLAIMNRLIRACEYNYIKC